MRRAVPIAACGIAVLVVAGRVEAGNITAAEAFGARSLGFFTVETLSTGEPDNDNSPDPVGNELAFSEGFLAPYPIDIRLTIVDEPGTPPATTEYAFDAVVTNGSTDAWMGFFHVVGFGVGDDFELAPANTVDLDAPHHDPTPTSETFAFLPWFQFSGARDLEWWGGLAGAVQPGGKATFRFYVDVPNSQDVPEEHRTPDGYTFTLRQYPSVPPPSAPAGWYRGNTHTHSHLSFDGHDPPADLAGLYEAMGYDFLVLTDHDVWSDFSQFSTPGLLCISGEEITHSTNHVTGLATTGVIAPASIAQNVAAVRAQDATPVLAHPSEALGGATGGAEIVAVDDLKHIEIHNGFFCCPHEYTELWDQVLSAGKLVYGVAADDSHDMATHVGRGWIVVRADTLDEPGILAAIEAGDFYASTGITLAEYIVDEQQMCVDSINGEWIRFVGLDGVVLQQTQGSFAQHLFQGSEAYVRAEVHNSYGQSAWMQPAHLVKQCIGDCDGSRDGTVGVTDLLTLLSQYDFAGDCVGGSCDLDGDGCVGILDLLALLTRWGDC